MMEYLLAAMLVVFALQIIVATYTIYRAERRDSSRRRLDPVIEAIYQDAMKELEEYGKTLRR